MSADDGAVAAAPSPLSLALATKQLSDVGYTADGSGVAFLKLDVAGKSLTDLAGVELPHVRFVVADGNPLKRLQAASLAGFKSLVTLSAAGCSINQLDDFTEAAPHLVNLDLSRNELVNLRSTAPPKKPAPPPAAAGDGDSADADAGVAADDDAAAGGGAAGSSDAAGPVGTEFTFAAPALRVLLLNHNKLITLEGLNGPSFSRLVRLELASNGLLSLAMDEPAPALRELILCHNALTSLAGLDKFPRLRLLDVDGNGITSLAPLLDVIKAWPAGDDAASSSKAGSPSDAEEDADAELRPLCALRVLSLRTTALPDTAWGQLDGLASLPRLRVRRRGRGGVWVVACYVPPPPPPPPPPPAGAQELRISGTPLAEAPYRPRRLDLSSVGDGEC